MSEQRRVTTADFKHDVNRAAWLEANRAEKIAKAAIPVGMALMTRGQYMRLFKLQNPDVLELTEADLTKWIEQQPSATRAETTKREGAKGTNMSKAKGSIFKSIIFPATQDTDPEAERESKAGYDIVSKQSAASVSWLKTAREDLADAYDALHRPEEAARFRAEAARVARSAAPR